MGDRWQLDRAGIINVFQYGEEVLRFGGGRLLLRGVNGSGKSTAMNMLLPFLLDADVRRIDAAGEQSGMLRSWMLSGREEPQPTGYLWLEVARGDDHLAFGCGIKANRGTDTVNHWWFVTDRRPGIDLDLVQRVAGGGRAPLSAEQLRAEIGAEAVWSKDQRSAYRNALHGRLYGGANLDQHLRLLHIVRNPRVGDRVDVDLPNHLHDALPQLSDASIDDAATPLEHLEEHRTNVAQLTATVRTLDALVATYRQHARSELRARAREGNEQAADHRRHEGRVRDATVAHEVAVAEAEQIGATGERWLQAVEVHRREIDALHKSAAYQSIAQLDDKRAEVAQLSEAAQEADAELEQAVEHLRRATDDVTRAEVSTGSAGTRLDESLAILRATASVARLSTSLPARPAVATGPLTGERPTDHLGRDEVVALPAGPVDDTESRSALTALRAAAQQRSDEVAEADEAMALVEHAASEVAACERRSAEAEVAHAAAVDDDERARAAVREESDRWRQAAVEWDHALADHIASCEHLASVPLPASVAEAPVAEVHHELVGERQSCIASARSAHADRVATLDARLRGEHDAAAEAHALVDELASRELPDPPSLAWQAPRSGPSLAELVDFADEIGEAWRAGLESALEASGLLAAEVRPEGLRSQDGELLIGRGPRVDRSLADVLAIVTTGAARVDHGVEETVRAVLASVSIDPADVERVDGPAATITVDGRFRLGPLQGSHAKPVAEHIGVTARREALERQRAVASEAAAAADAAVAATEAERWRAIDQRTTADRLASELPATADLVRAIAGLEHAELALGRAADAVDRTLDAQAAAERAHAQRLDGARRRCAELDLPHDRAALAAVADGCRLVPSHADNVASGLDSLGREVAGWLDAGARWAEAGVRRTRADERRARCRHRHEGALAELATLEDQIGLDAAQVLAAIEEAERSHDNAERELRSARANQPPAAERVGVTRTEADQAAADLARSEEACAAVLDRLHAVVRVPGLLTAALGDEVGEGGDGDLEAGTSGEDHDGDPLLLRLPAVPPTGAGLRTYARALLELVPDAPDTPADNVRNALRSRRPDLGAGWDAQDHQPDTSLPLAVEVVGPLGTMPLARAAALAASELRTAARLLSTQQDDALRNLLQGLIADEVAEKMHAADELVARMNDRLLSVRTTHGVGVSLRWRRRDDLAPETDELIDLLAKRRDLRHDPRAEGGLVATLSRRIDDARSAEPEAPYATLIAQIFDYRDWHRMAVMVHRPGKEPERLKRGTALSEGEKKMVSYQPLFAAVAASCDALAETAPDAPRFVLLDDAFAKVSEDNHPKLFGLLVDLDLDFIATSERLWGTHATVPELAITEVLRDADAGVIVLEHSHWDGRARTEPS